MTDSPPDGKNCRIISLYHFVALSNLDQLQDEILALMRTHSIYGYCKIASEGINANLCGNDAQMKQFMQDFPIEVGDYHTTFASDQVFSHAKVQIKNQIVCIGADADPTRQKGTYVEPENWNNLILQEDVTLIDTRNFYEVCCGTFEGAIDPKTRNFSQFPEFIQQNLDVSKNKKVAMFCTGGIRCEKSTCYLLDQGFEEVYHLKGGIINYLKTIDKEKSKWEGECFVFDHRLAIGHDLESSPTLKHKCEMCHRCLTDEDLNRPEYEQYTSCHYCFPETSEITKSRARKNFVPDLKVEKIM